MTEPIKNRRITFDPTITLGHVLTAIVILSAVGGAWVTMDKRVLVLEEFRQAQDKRDVAQDLAVKDKFQELRESIVDLRHSVERVADKVGAARK